MTILKTIKQNAIKHPERLAIVEQMAAGCHSITWKELDLYSDKLAYGLNEMLHTKIPLIVYGHKNPYMIICFLACVKSGRAYCPIDINVPLSRVEAIIREVNPEMILCTEPLNLEDSRIKTIDSIKGIIDSAKDVISPEAYVKKEDVFYIVFTSGSTGTPKGVQISRDCLDNFIRWAVSLGLGLQQDQHYTIVNQAPFSFDLSVMDLYLCLYTGGTLWCLSEEVQSNPKMMYQSLKESKANIWVSTPSFADVCLADPVFCSELMESMEEFLFCGEVLTNKTVKKLHDRFPQALVINTYGPTESTCAITSVIVTKELNETVSPLPVGIPKPGTYLKIVDENGNSVPDGEHGEIMIIGDSVSVGYWNNAERNQVSFGTTQIDGSRYRYYRTGDEGYVVNHMLYYCGRMDLQIKLHGYRIEIEDIENNMLKIPEIQQVVVVPKYRDGKVSSLNAGIVIAGNRGEDETAEIKRVKEILKQNLPKYMIPKKIKVLSCIPRTTNGKIDRKRAGGML